MLICMEVKHKLSEGALEACEVALQHNKTRTRELSGDLEIHLAQGLAEIEMLLRGKAVITLDTEAVVLDVIARVLAVGHLVEWQIGNPLQSFAKFFRDFLF